MGKMELYSSDGHISDTGMNSLNHYAYGVIGRVDVPLYVRSESGRKESWIPKSSDRTKARQETAFCKMFL